MLVNIYKVNIRIVLLSLLKEGLHHKSNPGRKHFIYQKHFNYMNTACNLINSDF